MNDKHLDYIQAVITRHNTNSFMIKGWAITLCTAVLTLASTWKEPMLALVALAPTLLFWILDSMYLANERCYVSLYTAVINGFKLSVKNKYLKRSEQKKSKNDKEIEVIELEALVDIETTNYSMDFTPFRKIIRNNWTSVFWSRTIFWFYAMMTGFSILVFAGLLFLDTKTEDKPINVRAVISADSMFLGEPVINKPFSDSATIIVDTVTK